MPYFLIKTRLRLFGLLILAVAPAFSAGKPFRFRTKDGAVVSIKSPEEKRGTEYIAANRHLGDVFLRYRVPGGAWREVNAGDAAGQMLPEGLFLRSRFTPQGKALLWTLTLQNRSREPLEVGDLAVPLPMNTDFSRRDSAGTSVLKHSFISGHGSFLFWMQPDSREPFLTMTPTGDTSLEYWDSQSGYRVFIHAARSLQSLGKDGTWRLPGTELALAPMGSASDTQVYGFKFQWAKGYSGVRKLLVDEGKVDVTVVPSMTVPRDLSASLSLRSRKPIQCVEAEFPATTHLEVLEAKKDGTQLYRVRFDRLGENRLTVRYGDGQRIFLEFFSTEPLETLIKKRASFIAHHQFRDPSKWYDGLLAEWNLDRGVMLGPDNYDQIKGWRKYEVTCDDPGLSKPAFLASKEAEFPVQSEVDALDYYVEHFVWGGLQQTREEGHPFGVYGIPDWKQNRESADPGSKGRLHLWRVYDYPHVTAMYLGLYRVAQNHPWIRTSLRAREYLLRAYGTAAAMFTVPLSIEKWSADETGLYNEIVIPQVILELEGAGLKAEAAELQTHWERKAQYFVNGKPDLFGSEYPFDSTGFESTHALATFAMQASRSKNPRLRTAFPRKTAESFLERQLAANIFCRGWVEPAYYLLGSDYRGGAGEAFTLSYMSPMGGGSILDYALHYARVPIPLLRLGYTSLLSSWALMNTGTADSNYGYWFPGQTNDGGAGGGFEPAAQGSTWLGQPHHRGAWFYSCETDLGYCGYLRNAATILADDPIFGRYCFGGLWKSGDGGFLEVDLRDGVRRRFHALLGERKLHLLLDNDRFFGSVALKEDFSEIHFAVESDNPAAHTAAVRVSGVTGVYRVRGSGKDLMTLRLEPGEEVIATLPMEPDHRCLFEISKINP